MTNTGQIDFLPSDSAAPLPDLPALSIRQPWAWAIVHQGKDIENRTWQTKFRGRFLIHAAKGCTPDEYLTTIHELIGRGMIPMDSEPAYGAIERGGIVGEAELVDCVNASRSRWFAGPYGFLLRNVKPLPFTPCKGALGFFKVGGRNFDGKRLD